jgi:bifunctional non-homologous end joining protein LigD
VLARTVDGALRYAGRVGSGLTGRLATELKTMLTERSTPPVADVAAPLRGRKLRWVEPAVVVDVEFLMWTDDGRLRAPVFRGIRTDKTVDQASGDG